MRFGFGAVASSTIALLVVALFLPPVTALIAIVLGGVAIAAAAVTSDRKSVL
jgi:hypothetical protein